MRASSVLLTALLLGGWGCAGPQQPTTRPGSLTQRKAIDCTRAPACEGSGRCSVKDDRCGASTAPWLFRLGYAAYVVGEHRRAGALFVLAYRRDARPALLQNAAEAYQKAGKGAEAQKWLALYRKEAARRHAAALRSARELFRRGHLAYAKRDFRRAAELFVESYRHSARPALLFNAAQAYRRAGMTAKAKATNARYRRLAGRSARPLTGRPPPVTSPPAARAAAPPSRLPSAFRRKRSEAPPPAQDKDLPTLEVVKEIADWHCRAGRAGGCRKVARQVCALGGRTLLPERYHGLRRPLCRLGAMVVCAACRR